MVYKQLSRNIEEEKKGSVIEVTTAGNTNSADYILPYGLTTCVRQLQWEHSLQKATSYRVKQKTRFPKR